MVPSLVRRITDPSLHRVERLEAVRALPSDLSDEELAALAELFRQPPPSDISAARWYEFLNELMTVLAQPRYNWKDFGVVMTGLMTDRHVDPVIRDYAAQYLATWLRGPTGEALPEADSTALLRGYLGILEGGREAFDPVFGTSLMMLCDLRDKRGDEAILPIRSKLDPVIAGYVDGTVASSLSNRLSAIQAAGRLSIESALESVRSLATDTASEPSVRLNCVAALGYYAEPEDRRFLEELASGDSRLRYAAQQALTNYAR